MTDGYYTPFYGAAYAREATAGHVILSLLHTMIELLRRADALVVSDQARARQLIDRVMGILHAPALCRLQLLDVSRKSRRSREAFGLVALNEILRA